MSKDSLRGNDPYEVLGVPGSASREDIVRAYHRAALGSHPDARPADSGAAGRFHAVTEAYELLTDSRRRAEYDRGRARQPDVPPSAPPSPSAGRPARSWSGPPLWAGPVHIEPAAQPPGSQSWHQPDDIGEARELLHWYLTRIWGWP